MLIQSLVIVILLLIYCVLLFCILLLTFRCNVIEMINCTAYSVNEARVRVSANLKVVIAFVPGVIRR